MARAALTRISPQYQVTVPKVAREALALKAGDILEATVVRGGVLLRPKVLRDRDEFLKELKADIEASKADVKAGRVLGPFSNARNAMGALRAFAKKKKHRAHARRAD